MAELSLGWKLWADVSQFTSSMKKAKDEAGSSTDKIGGSFRDLSKKLNAAKRDYLDLAAAMGPHNKAVIDAKQKLEALQKEYDSIKLGSGKSASSFTELKSSVLAVGAAVGGLSVITAATNRVIESSSALSDKWAETSTSVEWALSAMFRTIATGDWSNFLSNIRAAIEAGAEYARILDDVEDKQRALQIQDAKTSLEVEKLDRVVKNVNATFKERIAAVDQQNKLESELSASRKEAAKGEYDAAILQLSTQTKLGETTIKNFLENKKGMRQLKVAGQEYLDIQRQINDELQSASESYTPDMDLIEKWRSQQKALGNDAKAFSVVIERMGDGTDKAINEMIEKWSALYSTETEYLQATERGAMRKEAFLKSLNKETNNLTNSTKELKKATEELLDADIAIWNLYGGNKQLGGSPSAPAASPITEDIDMSGAAPATFGSSAQVQTTGAGITSATIVSETQKTVASVSQILSTGLQPVFANVFNSIGNLMVKWKEGFKGGLMEVVGAVADMAASVLSTIGSLVNESYDNKMAKLDQWYEKERQYIEASVMSEAQKKSQLAKLDKEADKKRRELQYKQAKDNKTVAIIQAAIAGALGIVNSLAQGGILGIVMAAIVGALAAVQIGVIASQPLPALATGGLAMAPTLAMVGDNPNAAIDPEVIAPLSKLKSMLGESSGTGRLEHRIRGDELLIWIDNAQKHSNRWV